VGLMGRVSYAAPPPPAPPSAAPVAEAVDEQSEFEKGRNAYRAQKYEEADARFLKMLDPEHGTLHDKVLIRQARMYRAASLIALHHDEDAAFLFELILTEDKAYEPDPLAFPTEVVNAFIDTRARLREKLEAIQRELYRRAAERRASELAAKEREAARIKMLEKLAGEAFVTQKHERWVALLPFGVGQFQNGQRAAGWFFLAAEATFVATGIATVPIYYVDLANAKSALGTTDTAQTTAVAQAYLDRANVVRYVNLTSYGALAVSAIVGAIQAEVAFVPEYKVTFPRGIPEVAPTSPPHPPTSLRSLPFSIGMAPLPGRDARGVGGGTLSVVGTF